ERLTFVCFRLRHVALFLENESNRRCAELELLLLGIEPASRELARRACRGDARTIHVELGISVSDFDHDPLCSCSLSLRGHLTLVERASVVRLCRSVPQRNLKSKSGAVSRIVEAVELVKHVADAPRNYLNDLCACPQARSDRLCSTQARVRVAGGDVENRQHLVLRVLDVDLLVFGVVVGLPQLPPVFECGLNSAT